MDTQILLKATNPNNEQLSAWMYSLIVKMTEKSPQIAQNVAQFLLKRLDLRNVHIQRKTLQVIAYLAEHGPYPFVEEVIKHEGDLRKLSDYRGAKDPIHGDELNQNLRTAAQKAIQSLYSAAERRQNTKMMDPMPGTGSFIGSGNINSFSSPNSAGFTTLNSVNMSSSVSPNVQLGNSQFQGYGNTSFSPSSNPTQNENESKGWGLKNVLSWKKGNNSRFQMNSEEYPNFLSMETKPYQPPIVAGASQSSFFSEEKTESFQSQSNGKSQIEWEPAETTDIHQGDLESQVIEELCGNNGVRVQPSRQELRSFTNRSSSMDMEKLCTLLENKLSGNYKWQTKLKALCAIEALIQENIPGAQEYFEAHSNHIRKQTEAVQSSISKKASNILSALSPQCEPQENLFSNNEQNVSNQDDIGEIFSSGFQNGDQAVDQPQSHAQCDGHFIELDENIKNIDSTMSLFKNMNLKQSTNPNLQKRSTSTFIDDIFAEPVEPLNKKLENSKQNILESLDILMSAPNTIPPAHTNTQNAPLQPTHPIQQPVMRPINNPVPHQGTQGIPAFTNNTQQNQSSLGTNMTRSPTQQKGFAHQSKRHDNPPPKNEEGFSFLKSAEDRAFGFVDDLLKKKDTTSSSSANKSAFTFIQ